MSMTEEGVSIIICCYNSAERLTATLEHVQRQIVDSGNQWEVIVVDNNSTDTTAILATEIWNKNPVTKLKLVTEEIPGLSKARICGANSARFSLLSFIDDDNWIREDWVNKVLSIFRTHPRAGACGGRIEAIHEKLPIPEWFTDYADSFAVGTPFNESGYLDSGEYLWGAGITIRKEAWEKLFNERHTIRLTGRKGNKLTAGEDAEICLLLHIEGYRLWYDKDLFLQHFIPQKKLSETGLIRMHEGFGEAELTLRIYRSLFDKKIKLRSPWWLEFIATLKYYLRVIVNQRLNRVSRLQRKTENAFIKGYLKIFLSMRKKYDALRQDIVNPKIANFILDKTIQAKTIFSLDDLKSTSHRENFPILNSSLQISKFSESKNSTTYGISVIVCCYNGEKTIHSCLQSLLNQKLDNTIPWEVILIDNNPLEDITRIAEAKWPESSISMKIFNEKREGLLHAKLRGYKEARYSLLAYIEDDTILKENWIQEVHQHFQNFPDCGVLGGNNEPLFMIEPPIWLNHYLQQLSVGKQGHLPIENITENRGFLWGAGMIIRKNILDSGLRQGFAFSDRRRRDHLVSGVDTEFCWLARIIGYKLYFNQNLQLTHVINAHRMSWINMQHLYRKLGSESISTDIMTYYYKKQKNTPALLLITRMYLGSMRRYFLAIFRYAFRSSGKVDNINFLMIYYYRGRMGELGLLNLSENINMIKRLLCFIMNSKKQIVNSNDSITNN